MAKKSMVNRNIKRKFLVDRFSEKRNKLLTSFKEADDFNEKLIAHGKLQKLPRNSFKVRIRNRCWKTGRPRAVFRDFGLSRHSLRRLAHCGYLPGVVKSSW